MKNEIHRTTEIIRVAKPAILRQTQIILRGKPAILQRTRVIRAVSLGIHRPGTIILVIQAGPLIRASKADRILQPLDQQLKDRLRLKPTAMLALRLKIRQEKKAKLPAAILVRKVIKVERKDTKVERRARRDLQTQTFQGDREEILQPCPNDVNYRAN
jgi:hypothetical protein